MCGLALHRLTVRNRVISQVRVPKIHQTLTHMTDGGVVLGMNHDQRALTARHRQGAGLGRRPR